MTIHIKKSIARCDDDIIERFSRESSATVHEAMGRLGAMDPAIKAIARGMKLCGRAVTVNAHPGDNIMLIKAINMARPGDVIVANMGGIAWSGPFGEVMATECVAKRVAGLVIDGSVRDSKAIIEMGFPVFASNISIRGTAKATLGGINHPIVCGGVVVDPGDIILGDEDGVVVVCPENGEAILDSVARRTAKEAEVMEKIKAGGSLFDIYGYQKVLDALGCIEEK